MGRGCRPSRSTATAQRARYRARRPGRFSARRRCTGDASRRRSRTHTRTLSVGEATQLRRLFVHTGPGSPQSSSSCPTLVPSARRNAGRCERSQRANVVDRHPEIGERVRPRRREHSSGPSQNLRRRHPRRDRRGSRASSSPLSDLDGPGSSCPLFGNSAALADENERTNASSSAAARSLLDDTAL